MSYNQLWGSNYFNATLTSGLTHGLTISVWIKKSHTQWDNGSANYVCNLSNNFTDDDEQVRIYTSSQAVVGVWTTTTSTSKTMDFTDDIYDDIWVPVINRYISNVSKYQYIEDSSSASIEDTNNRDIDPMDSFRLGRLMSSIGGFGGKIAEVTLWDKALSTAEIDEINPTAEEGPAGNTIASGNCVGYWPLDYDSATQTDESGTSNGSFTEVGTRVFDSDHPTITSDSGLLLRRRR